MSLCKHYANLNQKGRNDTIKFAICNVLVCGASGYLFFTKSPDYKKYTIIQKSFNEFGIDVSTSAKKKSLNLTFPKGATII